MQLIALFHADCSFSAKRLLFFFVSLFKTSPLKLHLTIAKPPMFDVDLASNKGDDHNVACVCCHDNIVGFRYKCVICPAYEICAK